MIASHQVRAQLLRKVSASTGLTQTMRRAVSALARAGIPSLVVGGYAVQERGYARFTSDVDIIVPDVQAARSHLSINGFRENVGSTMTVTDRTTKVEVDLLPGGGSVGPGPLKLPMPEEVSATPTIATLQTLIEIKLSSYLGSPASRIQDLADVTALIKANELPRAFGSSLQAAVANEYWRIWDDLSAERARPR
jgi:predicted nucleotidyltransferase